MHTRCRCNGARGWFPSNYVEMVSVNPDVAEAVRPTARNRNEQHQHQQHQQQQQRARGMLPTIPGSDEDVQDMSQYYYDSMTGSVQHRPNPTTPLPHHNGSLDSDDEDHFVDAATKRISLDSAAGMDDQHNTSRPSEPAADESRMDAEHVGYHIKRLTRSMFVY